ncbi:MAG: BatA domain-containing protein [Planctomycetaceae bacterium]
MFVQPWMLYALPIISLPILIHLINQRRFQNVQWAAMRFLLMANRMSRGYARIRQWLILLARTLAIFGLIIAVSRPLSSGWLSVAGGSKVDTTLILLDRSSSMSEQGPAGGKTKLETGRNQLIQSLNMLKSAHYVLIDSATNEAVELESPDQLNSIPQTSAVGASADVPAMMQTAYDYVNANKPGRTEVWLCSDVRKHDWDADGGRWQVMRDAFLEFQLPIRFHLLAYGNVADENRAIRVTSARRVETTSGVDLLLSLEIEQKTPVAGRVTIPVELELDGGRSTIDVELAGTTAELKDHAIPLNADQVRGWGRVSIPADENLADNSFYFVYDKPVARKTIIVAEDRDGVRPLALAAGISPDPTYACNVEVISADQLVSVEWDKVSLVLWQDQLPEGSELEIVDSYIARGGQVVFFPPLNPNQNSYSGVHWKAWVSLDEETPVGTWIGDQDLLANAQSGASLPVGELRVMRYCELEGEHLSLASLRNGSPLICRALTDRRNVYFCSTTATVGESSLARDGVVLYVMIHRALSNGSKVLGTTRQLIAERQPESEDVVNWRAVSETDSLSTEYDVHPGVYSSEERLFAVNRSLAEDAPVTVGEEQLANLFEGLEFDRVDDVAGNSTSLIQEVWRVFLALMMAALVAEALLCLPRKRQPEADSLSKGWGDSGNVGKQSGSSDSNGQTRRASATREVSA